MAPDDTISGYYAEGDNEDADDLFGEEYERQRAERAARNPFEGLTPEEIAALESQWEKPRRKSTTKRDKPEKRNQDRIWAHLVKTYGAMPRRVNSGQWRDPDGNMIMGAKAGTSDLIVLISFIIDERIRIGVYFAVETKSNEGRATDAQIAFIERVLRMGGAACVARTPIDVDAAIDAWARSKASELGLPVRAARMRQKDA